METTCCVVGAGPGGAVLALLLARAGIPVTLVESHADFERKFRGDTLHPPTMELMAQLGLAEKLLSLPHSKIGYFSLRTATESVRTADFTKVSDQFPFMTMLPQSLFIETVVEAAKAFPHFQLVQPAVVESLLHQGDAVSGVRCHGPDGKITDIEALLTVGADGRSSTVRRLAGIQMVKTSPPMDVLWFTLPRSVKDPKDLPGAFLDRGRILVVLERPADWQVGYVFPKKTFQKIRSASIEALRQAIAQTCPVFADRVETLSDWNEVSLLSVESSRCETWAKEGLLLIGDAAHVMSPVGGVGINYAIQDAVTAANLLSDSLHNKKVSLALLKQVQKKRERATRIIQFIQAQFQRNIIAQALRESGQFKIPRLLRLVLSTPLLREIPIRLMIRGIGNVHLENQAVISPTYS